MKDYYAAIAPHSQGGGYINFASADDQVEGAPPTTAPTSPGCSEVKRRYDPDNLFHLNQNIQP